MAVELTALDDLLIYYHPEHILLIGEGVDHLLDFIQKKGIPVSFSDPGHFANLPAISRSDLIIFGQDSIQPEAFPQLIRSIEAICVNICCGLVLRSPENAESIQYFSKISEAIAKLHYFRDLENSDVYSPWIVFRPQVDDIQAVHDYEESLLLLKLESDRKTQLLAEFEKEEIERYHEYNRQLEAINKRASSNEKEFVRSSQELLKQIQKLKAKNHEESLRYDEVVQRNQALAYRIEQLEFILQAFWSSRTGRMIGSISSIRRWLIPPSSWRVRILSGLITPFRSRPKQQAQTVQPEISVASSSDKEPVPLPEEAGGKELEILPVESRPPLQVHQENISIVVCVHNALEDVKICLQSIQEATSAPYELILVDDGSGDETAQFLRSFSSSNSITLIRNDTARGYTRAANQGILASAGEFVVLLNSDTIVVDHWLDRMAACARVSDRTGVVGPLSNTASYQSIPEYASGGDWAMNPLPPGISVQEMGRIVAESSGRLYPRMPLLNGFCLLVRRKVFEEIGLFDEDNFGAGYGEEDDFNLRARAAGWDLRLADDTYIYHAQSKSYSTEARLQLSDRAGKILRQKHGVELIQRSVEFMEYNRVLEGIRARSRILFDRRNILDRGRQYFSGKRILFVLPIARPGGGGNVVIYEATAMLKMGVEVSIFNLSEYKDQFLQSYPNLNLPVIFGDVVDLALIAMDFDAVIATANYSVEWFLDIPALAKPVLGYYVQGFEALMYDSGTPEYQKALDSYTLIPRMQCFTKTQWTQEMVFRHTGGRCQVIGVSVNLDLMRPHPRALPDWPNRPIRIGAMVRPDSPYREPERTMRLLNRAATTFGKAVEIVIFGADMKDPEFQKLPHDFNWSSCGIITTDQTAQVLNDLDIFVDYSSHQAMGLTALEAMANGCAVIVPLEGGAVSFANDHENALVVDTGEFENVWQGLRLLVEDHDLRKKLQRNALTSVCDYFPEKCAFNILNELLGDLD